MTVHGYSDDLAPMIAPVTTVTTLWIHPETGHPYILVMHESLFFGDRMGTTLTCPNQVRANGIKVEDVSQTSRNSGESISAIVTTTVRNS